MNMMLSEATERLEPTKVAPATYLIRGIQQALAQPLSVYLNSALILGEEPIVERFGNAYDFPLHRCRWVNDGEGFVAGDRTLVAVRPPLFDSPTTRGLLDTSTGVYWGVDTFATAMPGGPAHRESYVRARRVVRSGMLSPTPRPADAPEELR